jgi:RHS repeat-associated protein
VKLGRSTPVTYAYNNLDQLTTTSFGKHYYDARGNLINSSGVSSYTYDAMDRLITATVTAGTARYDYDHDGRRIKQTIGVTITNYLWDETSAYGDVVLETDGSGAVQAQYTLGHACGVCDVSGLISQKSGSTVSYYLKDGQGNVRALTNLSGDFVSGESYRYNAYGELQGASANLASKYLYTGQQFDGLTGLYSLRARYYNPNQGRFNSRDIYPVNFNNPIELNRYGYVAGNPINASDPSGYRQTTDSATLYIQTVVTPRVALLALGFVTRCLVTRLVVLLMILNGISIAEDKETIPLPFNIGECVEDCSSDIKIVDTLDTITGKTVIIAYLNVSSTKLLLGGIAFLRIISAPIVQTPSTPSTGNGGIELDQEREIRKTNSIAKPTLEFDPYLFPFLFNKWNRNYTNEWRVRVYARGYAFFSGSKIVDYCKFRCTSNDISVNGS